MSERRAAPSNLTSARAMVVSMLGQLEGELAAAAWALVSRALVDEHLRAFQSLAHDGIAARRAVRVEQEITTAPSIRIALQRFLGYSPRFERSVDEALRALLARRHVLVISPPGSRPEQLARMLHGFSSGAARFAVASPPVASVPSIEIRSAAGGTFVAPIAVLHRHARAMVESASAHDVRLVVIAPPAARVPFSFLETGAAVLRVPELKDRIEELPLLVSDIAEDVGQRLHAGRVALDEFMPVLYAYAWPHNLEELEQVVAALVARLAFGSTREAATLLGVTRSTLSMRLTSLGLGTRRRPRRQVSDVAPSTSAEAPMSAAVVRDEPPTDEPPQS